MEPTINHPQKELEINTKFRNLIPALTQSEWDGLVISCLRDGIQDSIKTWNNYIIDGHNRYKISDLFELPFTTSDLKLKDEEEAIDWIISNQLNRRNLTDSQKKYFIGLQYEREKKKIGTNRYTNDREDILSPLKTAEKIAIENKISDKTVKRNAEYSKAIDEIGLKAGEEIKNKLLNEEVTVDNKTVVQLSKQSEEEIKQLLKQALNNKREKDIGHQIKANLIEKKKKENMELLKKEIDNKPIIYLTDAITFLNKYEDNSVNLLITDPPYSTDVDNIKEFLNSWLLLAINKVKQNGRCYIWSGAYPEEMSAYLDILLNQNKFIVDNPIIWSYKNLLGVTPKMKYNLNYQVCWHLYSKDSRELNTEITGEMWSAFEMNAPDPKIGNRFFTWQKPDELARRLINHSTIEGDIIIDPFAGSGTFILIGNLLKRNCFGSEINKENLKIAIERGCKNENF